LWLSASPCLAAEPPLTEAEQRETLGYLEELAVLRQENAQLSEIVAKDGQAIASLQAENAALRQAQTNADKIIVAQDKLAEIQQKAMLAYKELALAEGLRADRAEKNKTLEVAGIVGGIITIAALVIKYLVKK
jgi:hypothetical protein